MALATVLREQRLVDDAVLARVEQTARRHGVTLLHALVEENLVDDDYIARLLAVRLRIDRIDLDARFVDPRIAALLPLVLAERYRVIPVGLRRTREGDVLYLAMSSPDDDLAVMEVQAATGLRLFPLVATDRAVGRALQRLYRAPTSAVPAPIDLLLPPDAARQEALEALPVIMGEIVDGGSVDDEPSLIVEGTPLEHLGTDEFLITSTHEVLRVHAPMRATSGEPTDEDWIKDRQENSRANPAALVPTTAVVGDDIGLRSWLKERLRRAVPDLYDFSTLSEVADFAASGALANLVLLHPRADARTMEILGALKDTPEPPRVVVIADNRGFEVMRGVNVRLDPPPDDEDLALAVLAALYRGDELDRASRPPR